MPTKKLNDSELESTEKRRSGKDVKPNIAEVTPVLGLRELFPNGKRRSGV
jgi:hypothetical protein